MQCAVFNAQLKELTSTVGNDPDTELNHAIRAATW
jgi:hypothetical protein